MRTFAVGPKSDYYLGFFTNRNINDGAISILLTTSDTQQVEYSIEAPCSRSGTLSAGDVVEVTCNRATDVEVRSSRDFQNRGIYLTASSDKITVIGQSLETHSSDSYFALPVIKLDEAYVYYGVSVGRAERGNRRNHDSSILIVGTENNTTVKVTTRQSVNINPVGGASINLIPGTEYSFVINRLQTFYIGTFEDLSGTKIVTDRPVSVFSGHRCARVPSNVERCSYLIEQIPPTALWGNVHYVAPFAQGNPFTVKIVAAYNFTIVNIYCSNRPIVSHTINEGEFINREEETGYCAIYSNKEVLVVQLSHGGMQNRRRHGAPMMTLVPATNQYLNTFEASTISNPIAVGEYTHYVKIIVMEQYYQPNMIYLIAEGINRSLDTEQWVPIRVNNIIEAYATQIEDIPQGMIQIFHTNAEAQMMTFVYGFVRHDGYGHIGGIHIPQGYYVIKLC